MAEPILMKLFTVVVLDLMLCMKEDNPCLKTPGDT